MSDKDLDKELEEMVAHICTATALVLADHKDEDWAGFIECPACKGHLRVSIAGKYNNHVHGRCETKGCLSWMQ